MSYKKIKVWKDVAKYHKIPVRMPDVSAFPVHVREYILACYMKPYIVSAINGKDKSRKQWRPDYTNSNQTKYDPWLKVQTTEENKSGVSLSYNDYDNWNTNTNVSPHLCNRRYWHCKPCRQCKKITIT